MTSKNFLLDDYCIAVVYILFEELESFGTIVLQIYHHTVCLVVYR